jgi:hypothetical protein
VLLGNAVISPEEVKTAPAPQTAQKILRGAQDDRIFALALRLL